ncbi:DUF6114 domain-containing protein [Halorientalis marina]|uniref:DUF6114 domain-containing protein n=1 Tax=Halorientalis marina TaxID=2931976 RepID=UPI001FF3620E|nr:DUF6114 domain-containing protein [Halorientalis marina]
MGYSPRGRPILGPLVLIGAGAVIAYVPLRFEGLLSIIGGGSPVVGFLVGGALACCGVGVHVAPSFSTELGVVAMALSVLSIFGALGGLVVGLVLGLLGGNICIAWRPAPEE